MAEEKKQDAGKPSGAPEEKADKTMITAQENAVKAEASAPQGGEEKKEEKTVMLEAEGTVLKDIIPGKLDAPEKRGTVFVLSGSESGKKYDVTGKEGAEMRAGRDDINDIIVRGEGVSRYHAKFVIAEGGQVKLVDLDSKNGTFVNGKKIKEQLLRGGEKVFFGDVACKFESAAGGSAGGKKVLFAAAAAVAAILVIAVFVKMSGGKDAAQAPQRAAVPAPQQVTLQTQAVPVKEKKSEDRLEQKISIAEREFEIGNYDDALQVAKSVLEKDASYKPALILVKKINARKQDSIDKEVLSLAKGYYEKNNFGDAKAQLSKISSDSSYYSEAQKYMKKIDAYPEAEKSYKTAQKLWNDGKIDQVVEKADAALSLIPEFTNASQLKEKALEVKALLSNLNQAEVDGKIKEVEKLAKSVQDQVKNAANPLYKMAQEKIDKIEFGKYYKANRYYAVGMKALAEGKYSIALQNFDMARQLLPSNRTYDLRYKETYQEISKKMKDIFFAAYVLAEKDSGRAKRILQRMLKIGVEEDPYYKRALKLLEN